MLFLSVLPGLCLEVLDATRVLGPKGAQAVAVYLTGLHRRHCVEKLARPRPPAVALIHMIPYVLQYACSCSPSFRSKAPKAVPSRSLSAKP